VWQRLVAEHGAQMSESTITRYVKRRRVELGLVEVEFQCRRPVFSYTDCRSDHCAHQPDIPVAGQANGLVISPAPHEEPRFPGQA
jgi:hypothetical protein